MSAFLSNCTLILNAVFTCLTSIFNLYTTTVVLGAVLGLWVLRKIVNLIRQVT